MSDRPESPERRDGPAAGPAGESPPTPSAATPSADSPPAATAPPASAAPAPVSAAQGEPAAPVEAAPADAAAELARLRRQLEETQDRLLRALADMDNLRRRVQREREEYTRYATEALLRELVPVLDNFDRALEAARSTSDVGKVVEGVELIQRELLRILERAGLRRYSALGQPFDPARHEATARVVRVDQPPDTVVAETAPGYLLHDRVLRAAQVTVAVAPDEDAA